MKSVINDTNSQKQCVDILVATQLQRIIVKKDV